MDRRNDSGASRPGTGEPSVGRAEPDRAPPEAGMPQGGCLPWGCVAASTVHSCLLVALAVPMVVALLLLIFSYL